jgi:UDP-N-acetylmuramoyl-tripeptide--D-alanyl-D-alanine ligase
MTPLKTVYFGVENPECSVRAGNITEEDRQLRFHVTSANLTYPVELALEGLHYVSDALAAVSVGMELGVNPSKIQENLSRFQNMAGRQEIFEVRGCTVIKDCYNAGPESMAAALNVLGKREGRRIAVLGDMLELGTRTQAEHYRIGRIAAEKVDYVYAYGPDSPRVIKGAITGGLVGKKARSFTDRDELVRELKKLALPGDTLLFKGSRGMRMELALEKFLEDDK